MDDLNNINLAWAYIALVAAGAIGGGISALAILLRQHRAGRRT